ncbi:T6SS immunity protein Tli4 family protein [Massilia sp. LXY-6]|uniref:T6SS immunity protein Tli4 family protein n=1 Tax=Massilia sp. LXY-6 TaxID=3379823 RepID=UPI003EE0C7FB
MVENMKTVCVGRYLVDVPAEAKVGFSGSMLDGFDFVTTEESESAFHERIIAREADIEAHRHDTDSDTEGGVETARDLRVPGMVGRTLIYGRSRGYLMDGERRVYLESVSVEVHAHINGLSFSLSAKSTEETSAKEAEALFARLHIRGKDEVPAAPGFCVPRAVFVEPLPSHKNEHIVMHLGLPDHPDLSLTLASIAGSRPGPSLLARIAQTDATTSADVLLRITKLRAGRRSINGVDGEEVLLRAREFNFTTTYGFNWETLGATDDPTLPLLSLELRTGINERTGGKPVDTSLHEDALLELWNSIASSIRLRKSGPPPRPGPLPEPQGPTLGTMATAREVCPQSGWWRCTEGGNGVRVHGGQVQYVRKGERMPQALLLPRQTLWQKLKRIQPSAESTQPTAWTLVDKRLRPRTPTTVALAPAAEPPSSADIVNGTARPAVLGSYVRTGEICPASGWWRCDEPTALDGTRWFAQGSVLPAATLQVPAGVFAKSVGPELIHRRSGWQLMRHAEPASLPQAGSPLSNSVPVDESPGLA